MNLLINGRQYETDVPITLLIDENEVYLTYEEGVLKLRFTMDNAPWISWEGATLAVDCSCDDW